MLLFELTVDQLFSVKLNVNFKTLAVIVITQTLIFLHTLLKGIVIQREENFMDEKPSGKIYYRLNRYSSLYKDSFYFTVKIIYSITKLTTINIAV